MNIVHLLSKHILIMESDIGQYNRAKVPRLARSEMKRFFLWFYITSLSSKSYVVPDFAENENLQVDIARIYSFFSSEVVNAFHDRELIIS